MSTSYPYVTLARDFGLSYGVVLLCADRIAFDNGRPVHPNVIWWAWASNEVDRRWSGPYGMPNRVLFNKALTDLQSIAQDR